MMEQKKQKTVAQRISELADNDEDSQQELWLHVLSKPCVSDEELKKVQVDSKTKEDLRLFAEHLSVSKIDNLVEFINKFSSTERELMLLSIAGLSRSEMAGYLNISIVRINSIMQNIEKSNLWEAFYGAKDKIHGR